MAYHSADGLALARIFVLFWFIVQGNSFYSVHMMREKSPSPKETKNFPPKRHPKLTAVGDTVGEIGEVGDAWLAEVETSVGPPGVLEAIEKVCEGVASVEGGWGVAGEEGAEGVWEIGVAGVEGESDDGWVAEVEDVEKVEGRLLVVEEVEVEKVKIGVEGGRGVDEEGGARGSKQTVGQFG